MAEFLGTVQLGGFYNKGEILNRPMNPWRPDSAPPGWSEGGDIPEMSGSMADYTIGDTPSSAANRLQWHKIKDGGKTLFICDRVILVRVSWDDLNEQGYVTGKTVTIDGAMYKCRLLTGGSAYRGSDGYSGGSPTNNEWDRFITREEVITGLPAPVSSDLDTTQNATDVSSTHNQFWNWLYVYSWCQETYAANAAYRVYRGYNSARHWNSGAASNRSAGFGFRPVLEVLNTPPGYKPTLGSMPVMSTVKLNEGGTPVEFYVATHDYESELNGAGRTLLVRKDCYDQRQWNSISSIDYPTSDIDAWFNGTYKNLLDADIQAAMGTTKFYYTSNSGPILERAVFQLSAAELGVADSHYPNAGTALPGADILKIAYLNGSAIDQWTRTAYESYTAAGYDKHETSIRICRAISFSASGSAIESALTSNCGSRPVFTLPATLIVDDGGFVVTNTASTVPGGIAVPSQINGGSTITISWEAATDAEDNLEGYKVERSLDGGTTWTQIYQGPALTATNTVPFGTESVMYRVKAYDAEGLESGWKTSAQVTVINNTAPTVPGNLTVPEQVQGGQPLAISWGESMDGENNLEGYALERQVDGGDWETIYSGPELSFTDQITKGWQTVAYRVRAYDTASAYSGFAVSEAREVNNNTPPAITCDQPYGTNLGVKSEGFSVSYSVADEEEDAVTVTEAVDGAALRTFAVELGADNSFTLDGEAFMKLLNGRHTLSITAADDASSATHSLSFEKLVTSASVTLTRPMEADGPISVCVLSVSGFIPADADYRVEVTNNALDDEPVWEDCTAAVRAGANHVFENKDAANGFVFDFRLNVSRGESGTGGYITSVQGGFQ